MSSLEPKKKEKSINMEKNLKSKEKGFFCQLSCCVWLLQDRDDYALELAMGDE